MTEFTFRLDNRTALVTGAGQGVGREIAMTLASHGAKVVVNDFVLDRAQGVVDEIKAEGGQALAAQADVGDMASVQAMMDKVKPAFGAVDVLINNAGNAGPDATMPRTNFWEQTSEEWDRYFHVNLFGVMNCAKACIPDMVERQYGRVVTIVSDSGRNGEKGHEAYSAAKAGASGFSRALARSMGRYGITANTISLSNIGREGGTLTPASEAAIKEMLKFYIIRRQGKATDVAAVALLLASEASGWITAQNYPVNGGFTVSL